MLLVPVAETAKVDPFLQHTTLSHDLRRPRSDHQKRILAAIRDPSPARRRPT